MNKVILSILMLIFTFNINYTQILDSEDMILIPDIEFQEDSVKIYIQNYYNNYVFLNKITKDTLKSIKRISEINPYFQIPVEIIDTKSTFNMTCVEQPEHEFLEDSTNLIETYGTVSIGYYNEEFSDKKTVLLVIDSTTYPQIQEELKKFKEDLSTEGWGVREIQFWDRSNFEDEEISKIPEPRYDRIHDFIESSNLDFSSIILIGDIPVFYSGLFAPDEMPNHSGAWPADGMYGVVEDGIYLFRNFGQDVSSDWKRNHNDNIFTPDYNKFPANVKYMVGRIDMSNLPAFEESEIELIKRYFNKNHEYRNDKKEIKRRGLVDDNISIFENLRGFANSGILNFSLMFGYDSLHYKDFFSTLENESYMGAYGCGTGFPFDSIEGIGSTQDFATLEVNAVFTMLYGEYVGDWDSENNILRAALASKGDVLTCAWAGSPHWYMHDMPLGYPIGYSLLQTQNNKHFYMTKYNNHGNIGNEFDLESRQYHREGVHISLLGDPTLTMFPLSEEGKPDNMKVELGELPNIATISWDVPDDNEEHYYDIYRATDHYGPWEKINEEPVIESNFTDEFNYDGEVSYMVRERVLEYSETAIFWKHLRGEIKEVNMQDLSTVDYVSEYFNLKVYPNPAEKKLTVEYKNTGETQIELLDLKGNVVFQTNTLESTLNINVSDLPSGSYILRLIQSGKADYKKVVIK